MTVSAQPPECPSPEQLRSALSGSTEDHEAIEHLSACPACQKVVEGWQQADALAGSLHALRPGSPSAQVSRQADLPPGYLLEHEVARGGQAVVLRALQESTQRPVALKMLLFGAWATTEQRERLHREARLAARLHHPHIVQVYDSGETPAGIPYLVLEWVDGTDLSAFVCAEHARSEGPRTTLLFDMFDKLAAAIEAAHAAGVLHRDLKPSNVLVDRQGEPRVVDFGLAKSLGAGGNLDVHLTRSGAFLGSLAWASPEQLEPGATIDQRIDIHGLGLLLYFMLTGEPAHGTTDSIAALLRRISTLTPEPPSRRSKVGAVAPAIDRLVLRALAKDPALRFASVAELRAALGQARQGRAPAALFPTRRGLVVGSAAALAAVVWRLMPNRPPVNAALAQEAALAALQRTSASESGQSDLYLEAEYWKIASGTPPAGLLPETTGVLQRESSPLAWAMRSLYARSEWVAALRCSKPFESRTPVNIALHRAGDLFCIAQAEQLDRVSNIRLELGRISSGRIEQRFSWGGGTANNLEFDPEGQWLCLAQLDQVLLWKLDEVLDQPTLVVPVTALGASFLNSDTLAIGTEDTFFSEYSLSQRRIVREHPWQPSDWGPGATDRRLFLSPDGRLALYMDLKWGENNEVWLSTHVLASGSQTHRYFGGAGGNPLLLSSSLALFKNQYFRFQEDGTPVEAPELGSRLSAEQRSLGPEGSLYVLDPESGLLQWIDPESGVTRSFNAVHPRQESIGLASAPELGITLSLDRRGLLRACRPRGDHWRRSEDWSRAVTSNQAPSIHAITSSPEGSVLFTADGLLGTVSRREGDRWTIRRLCPPSPNARVNSIAVSPDGQLLACSSSSGVHLGSAQDLESLREVYRFPGGTLCNMVRFAPDGTCLAACSGVGEVALLEAGTGSLRSLFEVSDARIGSLAFAGDSSQLYCGDGRGRLHRLDTHSGKVTPLDSPHKGNLGSIASDRSGRLATGSLEGVLALWEQGADQPFFSYVGPICFVYALAFQGPHLLSCNESGLLIVREAATGQELARFEGCKPNCLDILTTPAGSEIGLVGNGQDILWLDFAALDRAILAHAQAMGSPS